MYLNVFDVEVKGCQLAVERPLPGVAEWTTYIERASHDGMSGDPAAQIRVPQGVKIELVHLKREVGGIAIAQLHVAANQQRTMLQVGIARHMQGAALSKGLQVQITLEFMIQGQITDVNVRIDGRCSRSAGAFEDEVSAPFHR